MLAVILRPEPAASGTAARARALGYETLVAPVTRIEPTGKVAPQADFDAVIVTSAHGLLGKGGIDAPSSRLFAVGSRTAEAARAAGFRDITDANGDARTLAACIAASMPPGARLLYLAGERRKPDLERLLTQHGFELTTVETYRAAPVTAFDAAALRAFATRDDCAILHLSRGHAEIAFALARDAGLGPRFAAFSHHALSDDVAEPARRAGVRRLAVATFPDEPHLLETLATA